MKALLDDNTLAPWRGTEPDTVIPGELEVRTALPDELQRVATSLNDEHYCNNAFGSISRPNSKETSPQPSPQPSASPRSVPPLLPAKQKIAGTVG